MSKITKIIRPKDKQELVEKLTERDLRVLQFSMPWSSSTSNVIRDEDGFAIASTIGNFEESVNFRQLQDECWLKFVRNPQVNTSIRDTVGRVTGTGFDISSQIKEINEVIREVMDDPRNRLIQMFPKYFGRAEIEGELFLCVTLHKDGFTEVDFVDPTMIKDIILHPTKPTMPIAYKMTKLNPKMQNMQNVKSSGGSVIIPSIYVAYYPEIVEQLKVMGVNDPALLQESKGKGPIYREIGGFKRFIVAWDRSFLTKRNVSHLRTTLEWLNHYENLKKYEIDHKKSSGAYLWKVKFEDIKAFKQWLLLSDTEKAQTGLLATKVPGGTIMLPPGMEMECVNPNLSRISDQDTDIMQMVTSGLNMPEDMVTGSNSGTYASAKASRAPQSDRVADHIENFRRFLKYDFWRAIFFLRNVANGFPLTYEVEEVTGFKTITVKTIPAPPPPVEQPAAGAKAEKPKPKADKNKQAEPTGTPDKVVDQDPTKPKTHEEMEPVIEIVTKPAIELVEFTFPTSALADLEAVARALLGVKHGSVVDTLGIPKEVVAQKLGFGNYKKLRLQHATEEETLPELTSTLDAESVQEQTQAEPSRGVVANVAKSNKKKQEN